MTVESMLDDKRKIIAVRTHGGDMIMVDGASRATRIEVYPEPGQGAVVPWLAIFVDDSEEPVARIDVAGCEIWYREER
jgi:hypothetical protein